MPFFILEKVCRNKGKSLHNQNSALSLIYQKRKTMTTSKAIQKIEKATGEKVLVNANGQHYTNRISFYTQAGEVICIRVDGGSYYDNLTQALKRACN